MNACVSDSGILKGMEAPPSMRGSSPQLVPSRVPLRPGMKDIQTSSVDWCGMLRDSGHFAHPSSISSMHVETACSVIGMAAGDRREGG